MWNKTQGKYCRIRAYAFCLTLAACSLFAPHRAYADRVILSPLGDTLPIESFKAEYITGRGSLPRDLAWFTISSSSGIELELQRAEVTSTTKQQYSLNIEYPQIAFGNYLSISYGVRDVTGTGMEHGAIYAAAMAPIRFYGHKPFLKKLRLNAGVGTGRMDGIFFSVEAYLPGGIRLATELYRQRPNVGIALPVGRNLQAKAYSLDGDIYYGLALSWTL